MKKNIKIISLSLLSLLSVSLAGCGTTYPFIEELIPTYRVRFYDSEEKVNLLYEIDDVKEHENVTFPDDITPTKEEDEYATYTFSGWDKSLDNIIENTDFYAQYDSVSKKYTVTYMNSDETVLYVDTVKAGEASVYKGNTPTRESSTTATFTFSGWDVSEETLNCVLKDIVTYALFTSNVRLYTVKFYMDDGETKLKEESVEYGGLATAPTGVTKESVVESNGCFQLAYTFTGWDKDPLNTKITEDNTVFKAVFSSERTKTDKGILKQFITECSDSELISYSESASKIMSTELDENENVLTTYTLSYIPSNQSFAYVVDSTLTINDADYNYQLQVGFNESGLIENGSFVNVTSSSGTTILYGSFTPKCSGRILAAPGESWLTSYSGSDSMKSEVLSDTNIFFTKLYQRVEGYFTQNGLPYLYGSD